MCDLTCKGPDLWHIMQLLMLLCVPISSALKFPSRDHIDCKLINKGSVSPWGPRLTHMTFIKETTVLSYYWATVVRVANRKCLILYWCYVANIYCNIYSAIRKVSGMLHDNLTNWKLPVIRKMLWLLHSSVLGSQPFITLHSFPHTSVPSVVIQ